MCVSPRKKQRYRVCAVQSLSKGMADFQEVSCASHVVFGAGVAVLRTALDSPRS